MHRPRHRRKDPKRTGPIRNAGEAWRKREPPADLWEPEDDDPASYGVRVGSSVIDEQIRRGRRMAQDLHREPRAAFCGRGARGLFGMPLRHLESLLREILGQVVSGRPNPWKLAELLLHLQIEAFSELARLGFGALGMASPRWGDSYAEDVDRVTRDIDEGYGYDADDEEYDAEDDEEDDEEPWTEGPRRWPAAPSASTTIRSTVPIPVYVSSHERTEIGLELPAGSQSLDLELEPPLAAGTDELPLPAFEGEFVRLADGPTILRIEVPRDLPAGLYRRRVLVHPTGDPVGDVTIQVGPVPKAAAKTGPKARKR